MADEEFDLTDVRELLPMVFPNNQDHLHDLRVVNNPSGLWLRTLIQNLLVDYEGRVKNFKSSDQLMEYLILMEQGLSSACVMVTLDLESKDVSITLLNKEERQSVEEKERAEIFLHNILRNILCHSWSDI